MQGARRSRPRERLRRPRRPRVIWGVLFYGGSRRACLGRIARGLGILKVSSLLKRVAAPDLKEATAAIARRDGITTVHRTASRQPTGLARLQPPAVKNADLTTGRSCTLTIGCGSFRLRHAGPEVMGLGASAAGDAVRALHWLGCDLTTDPSVVAALRRRLPLATRQDLASARQSMRTWVARIVEAVLQEG
jgi:hypothetical protein